MHPTEQSLKDCERDMGAIPWQREMLLKIVADEDQIIKPEDIHYYDEKPTGQLAAMKGHGIDLAISQGSLVIGMQLARFNCPKAFLNKFLTIKAALKVLQILTRAQFDGMEYRGPYSTFFCP
jgi:hypothetical protein